LEANFRFTTQTVFSIDNNIDVHRSDKYSSHNNMHCTFFRNTI